MCETPPNILKGPINLAILDCSLYLVILSLRKVGGAVNLIALYLLPPAGFSTDPLALPLEPPEFPRPPAFPIWGDD